MVWKVSSVSTPVMCALILPSIRVLSVATFAVSALMLVSPARSSSVRFTKNAAR